jgi:hypothetical protein
MDLSRGLGDVYKRQQLDGTEFIDCTFNNCDTPEDLTPK